jgi:hypothetical protein
MLDSTSLLQTSSCVLQQDVKISYAAECSGKMCSRNAGFEVRKTQLVRSYFHFPAERVVIENVAHLRSLETETDLRIKMKVRRIGA